MKRITYHIFAFLLFSYFPFSFPSLPLFKKEKKCCLKMVNKCKDTYLWVFGEAGADKSLSDRTQYIVLENIFCRATHLFSHHTNSFIVLFLFVFLWKRLSCVLWTIWQMRSAICLFLSEFSTVFYNCYILLLV